jgi:hypothetical protein
MRNWQAGEWASVRARGKTNFLVRYGFLQRGLPFGVLIAVVIELALGSAFPEALRSPVFLFRLVALVALFSLSGCMRASVTWNAYEKRFGQRA